MEFQPRPTRKKRRIGPLCGILAIALVTAIFTQPTTADEASIMSQLTDKTLISADGRVDRPDGPAKEFEFQFDQEVIVMSSFVAIIGSQVESIIQAYNQASPLSKTTCVSGIYTTGFYQLSNCRGDTFKLSTTDGSDTYLSELRFYQSKNLAQTVQRYYRRASSSTSTSSTYTVINLIENHSQRTLFYDVKPYESTGEVSTLESCFRADASTLSSMQVYFYFKTAPHVDAVTVVQGLNSANRPSQGGEQDAPVYPVLYTYEVYVSISVTDLVASSNKCPGGPHSATTIEVWCNRYGHYITVVPQELQMYDQITGLYTSSTLSQCQAANSDQTLCDFKLCNFGVFGTPYRSLYSVSSTVTVGQDHSITKYYYIVAAQYSIGNSISSGLRQKSGASLNWVSISLTSDSTIFQLTFNAVGKQPGDFNFTLEWYDKSSSLSPQPSLVEEMIVITVLEAWPPGCSSAQMAPTTSPTRPNTVTLIHELEPDIRFKWNELFTGPHTHSPDCEGTYSLKVQSSVNGVSLSVSYSVYKLMVNSSTPASFTLTFTGTYSHFYYQTTAKTASFTQDYVIETMYKDSYMQLSSFQPAKIDIDVAILAPTQTYSYNVDKTFSINWSWIGGSLPSPSHPSSYSSWVTSLTSKQTPIVVWPDLSSDPHGTYSLGQSVAFPCSAWLPKLDGQTLEATITPATADSQFSTELKINCIYEKQILPKFAANLTEPIAATVGVAQRWQLPNITLGTWPIKNVTVEGDIATRGLISIVKEDADLPADVKYFVDYAGGDDTSNTSSTTDVNITLIDTANLTTIYPMTVALTYIPPPPNCQLTDVRIAQVTALLATEKLELSLQAGRVGTTNALYQPFIDQVEAKLALTDYESTQCGSLEVNLVTTHTFLSLVQETQAVFLQGDEKTVPTVHEDATIEFKLATAATWSLQIKVSFIECTITELAFSRLSLDITYKVGSGEQRSTLPGFKQKPDCGQTFTVMTLKTIQSSLAQEQVLTAMVLDTAGAAALVIQTDDPAFANQKVSFKVELEQEAVSEVVELKVAISFEVDPPAFDLEGFTAAPLTCGPEMAEWSLLLPPFVNAEAGTVDIQIVESEQTQYFVLTGDSVSFEPTSVEKFIADQCAQDGELSLEMALISPVAGENQQTLAVKIEAVAATEEATTTPSGFVINTMINQNQQGQQVRPNIQENQFKPPPKVIKPLEVSKLRMSPTGQLTITFSKPIEIRSLSKSGRKLQAVGEEIDIGDAIEVFIEGQKESEVDKSIMDVKIKKASETQVKIEIEFSDRKAISEQISEPDILIVKFSDPGVIIDKETGKPLGDVSFEKRIEIGAQFTAVEFDEIVDQAETAAQISIAVTIWEIVIIMVFKKVLFSMWVLILTLQFFVYMATWQVRYPGKLHFILYELKRIALGEFMDDLVVGDKVNEYLGLPQSEGSAAEEKVAEERLGSGSIAQNFGATLLLGSVIFALLLVTIIIVIFISKRVNLKEKAKERVKSLKTKVFWNPIIRYLTLNSLKLSMTAIIVQKTLQKAVGDTTSSIVLLVVLNGAPLIFCIVVRRHHHSLKDPDTIKSIGAIYVGKNVTAENHCAWVYPMVFFWRRTLFIVITVYLFKWPYMQMLAHQVLSVVTIGILLVDSQAYESNSQKVIEVGSEVLMHFTSIGLSQFTVQSLDDPTKENIEMMTLVLFGCLLLLNISFIVLVYVQDCKEKKRKKMIEKRKKEYLERQEEKNKQRSDFLTFSTLGGNQEQKEQDSRQHVQQLEAISEEEEEEEGAGGGTEQKDKSKKLKQPEPLLVVEVKARDSSRNRASTRALINHKSQSQRMSKETAIPGEDETHSPAKILRVNDLGSLSERSSSSDESQKQVDQSGAKSEALAKAKTELAQVDQLLDEVERIFAQNDLEEEEKQQLNINTTHRDNSLQLSMEPPNNSPRRNGKSRRRKKTLQKKGPEKFDPYTLGDETEPDLENARK